MSRPIVAGLGKVSLDFVGVVPRLPEHEAPVELAEISVQPGGAAAIATGTAAAMGCGARLACKLADDFLGSFILRALKEAGVETRGLLAHECQLSGFSFSAVASTLDRRIAFFSEGDVGTLAVGEIDIASLLDGASAVVVDGFHPAAQCALAEAARNQSIPVIFDGSELREGVGNLVALADILICSERFAAELAACDGMQQTLLEIQSLGPRAVIVTLGESGSIGLHGDRLVEQPAFATDFVDGNGAGSVYHGAFTAALLNELPFARCMEFASAAAALACRRLGGWAGIPARDDVVSLVRTRSAH